MYIGRHVKYPLFFSDFNETWISSKIKLVVQFHENSSSASRAVPCGRTDKHDEGNKRFS